MEDSRRLDKSTSCFALSPLSNGTFQVKEEMAGREKFRICPPRSQGVKEKLPSLLHTSYLSSSI